MIDLKFSNGAGVEKSLSLFEQVPVYMLVSPNYLGNEPLTCSCHKAVLYKIAENMKVDSMVISEKKRFEKSGGIPGEFTVVEFGHMCLYEILYGMGVIEEDYVSQKG